MFFKNIISPEYPKFYISDNRLFGIAVVLNKIIVLRRDGQWFPIREILFTDKEQLDAGLTKLFNDLKPVYTKDWNELLKNLSDLVPESTSEPSFDENTDTTEDQGLEDPKIDTEDEKDEEEKSEPEKPLSRKSKTRRVSA